MNLRELLQRWSELEPERCILVATTGVFHVLYAGAWHPLLRRRNQEPGELSPTSVALLQGALQEAIAARLWGWELRYGMRPSKRPALATILRYASDGMPAGQSACWGEPAPEALLAAYVAALQVAQA